jgi:nucleotide-binding universal stress UspA family protein
MQRLLLPVDGSECSLRAVRHVIAHAGRVGREDVALHVVNVQPPLPSGITSFVNHAQVEGFQKDEGRKALAGALALLDEAGLPYEAHAEVGPLAETIVNLAEKLGCDEIVMGTMGRSALADFLMGSTVTRVVHLSRRPILLVK